MKRANRTNSKMKIYQLRRTQFIQLPREEVFKFFERADNLEKITPVSLGFKIMTPPPIHMNKGTIIDYSISILGVPVRWTTAISDYDPPHRFSDVQLKGPYSFWHHTHLFEEKDGGTIMTDIVFYSLGFGILGDLLHVLFVKSRLDMIFNFRYKAIQDFFLICHQQSINRRKVPSGLLGRSPPGINSYGRLGRAFQALQVLCSFRGTYENYSNRGNRIYRKAFDRSIDPKRAFGDYFDAQSFKRP